MTNAYEYWQQALNGNFGNVHEGDPQCGFYRKKVKGGTDLPVAIWQDPDSGKFNAKIGNSVAKADEIWTWVCSNPVTHEAYQRVIETGHWPDDAPEIGHNSNTGDVHTDLLIEFEGEKELAEQFLKEEITTQEQADKAAVWSKRLAGIAKKATDQHKVEKQPHLDAGREVDEKWRGLREGAKDLSTDLKRHMDKFLREQARQEEERRRKAEQEAEAKRIEAEKAAQAAADNEAAKAEAERLADEAAEAEKEAKAKNSTAGRTGAKVALRTFISAEITDFEKLLLALKDREEIKELVQSLANRAAKAGVELEGMTIKEEKRAA